MITFDEATHTYTRNNIKYKPVTNLLKEYNLSADYTNIPTDILEKAAERGSRIHKELENFIKYGTPSNDNNVLNFQKYVTAHNIDLTQASSEECVFNDNYLIAGTIDFQYTENGYSVLADFKTTSQIHWQSVSWQLSIYNYMKCSGDILMYYTKILKVYHMYNGKLTVREVPLIDYDEVVKLLEANLKGAPYTYQPDYSKLVSDSEAVVISTLLDEIAQCETLLKELKSKKEKMQESLVSKFASANEHNCLVGDVKIKYIDGTTRKTLDTDKVKAFCDVTNVDIDMLYTTSDVKPRIVFTKLPKRGY